MIGHARDRICHSPCVARDSTETLYSVRYISDTICSARDRVPRMSGWPGSVRVGRVTGVRVGLGLLGLPGLGFLGLGFVIQSGHQIDR